MYSVHLTINLFSDEGKETGTSATMEFPEAC